MPPTDRQTRLDAPHPGGAGALMQAGALGGLALALIDALPSVMWLPEVEARVWLGLRLFGLLLAVGVGLGALVAVSSALARRMRRPWLAPLLVTAALALPIGGLVEATFSGPRISQAPYVAVLQLLAAGGLTLAVFLIAHHARRLGPSLRRARRRRLVVATALAALVVVLTQCDRLLFPRHYDAIHGALTVAAFAAAAGFMWLVVPTSRVRGPVLLGVALGVFVAVVWPLASDHDGRAALLSPRASNARSVMSAVSPALFSLQRREASADAREQAARAARARRAARSAADSVVVPGAHLVVVTVDALRADHLGAYGYERPISENLDRLAASSTVFERAWTPTPRSSYAISSLMIGRPTQALAAADGRTLADRLGGAGLYTAAFYPDGIFFHEGEHLEPLRARGFGFARRDGEYRDADSLTDLALRELADLRLRGEPQSFLWVHYFDVHAPYEERSLGGAPVDRYDGEIRNVDRAFARLLAGLEALERDVVLVVTADHGEEHGDHGGAFHGDSLYEEQLWVPLIIRVPGVEPRRIAEPVSLLDVAPTVLALLGVEAPGDLEGVDLRPALAGRALSRGPIFATERDIVAVLDWPHKLIEHRGHSTLELFDLAADPTEQRSLASRAPDRLDALLAERARLVPTPP